MAETKPKTAPKSELKIVKQFTRFVYAFSYDEKTPFNADACIEKDGQSYKVFKRFSQGTKNLRYGLDELLNEHGGPSKIADCYEINEQCRDQFFLPKNSEGSLQFFSRDDSNKAYDLTIPTVQLFLFESGVGFISIEAVYGIDDIDDINEYFNCNYYMSEINRTGNRFVTTYKTPDGKDEECQFTTKQLLEKVLGYVSSGQVLNQADSDAVQQKSNSIANSTFYTGGRGVVFSYILFDKQPDNIHDLLYLARKNYVQSYKAPNIYSNIKDDPYVKRIYDNMYWSCSYNAAVNISYLVNDVKSDNHSTNSWPNMLRQTYFFLFINALHQRCAIMKYISDMGTLDELDMDYDTMKRELKQCNAMHSAALNLKFRDFFLVPSTIENINIYYDLLLSSFCVNTLYKSFIDDINMLKSLCDSYVTRINERDKKLRQKRKIKVGIFVSMFGSLVALASLINSYWSVLEKAFGKSIPVWSAPVIIAICLIIVPVVTIIMDTVEQAKEARKITKELADEREDNLVESDKDRKALKKLRDREKKQMRKNSRKNNNDDLSAS